MVPSWFQHYLSHSLVILVDAWPVLNSPKGPRTYVPENEN